MLLLHAPQPEELAFKQQMLADPATMAYNHAWGGVIPFPRERWADWHARWVGQPEGRFYRYLQDGDSGAFVGEIAWHRDGKTGRPLADVIVHAPFRGRGYGREGLALLCAAAREAGLTVLYDDMAADNPAAGLFRAFGFTEEGRTAQTILLKKDLTVSPLADRPREIPTPRLLLRPLEDADAADVTALLCDGQINQTYMLPDFSAPEEALPLFRRLRDLSRAPDHLIYGAELQGRIIGYLNDVRLENNGLEVGYVMSPAHWNRGYCTEMLAAVRDALFRLGFAALRAGYFEGNHASRRVMEKCGLRPTGETETIAYRGKDRKVICMALLRE